MVITILFDATLKETARFNIVKKEITINPTNLNVDQISQTIAHEIKHMLLYFSQTTKAYRRSSNKVQTE